MLRQIAALEGGAEAETTYDGTTLLWTQDAKRALWTMKDAYQRRRAKARVEKGARGRRLNTITLEFARQYVEEETGEPLVVENGESTAATDSAGGDGLKLIARDEKKNPLLSRFSWTPEAADRILRVPAGFMRDRTQQRVEQLATESAVETIDLALVDEGIALGRKLMEEMIVGYDEARAQAKPGNGGRTVQREKTPASTEAYLNEVGILSALEAKRRGPSA